jgi:hypothetical protein
MGGFQPVPISSVPNTADPLLVGYDWALASCPNYQDRLRVLRQAAVWQRMATANTDLFAVLSNVTGQVVDMDNAASVHDVFVCYAAHDRLSFFGDALTPAVLDQLQALVRWQYGYIWNDYPAHRIVVSTLLSAIGSALRDAAADASPLRLVHLSGHDTTLMPLLAALQAFSGDPIPYAGSVRFELRSAAVSGALAVSVLYEHEPLRLRFCSNQTTCPLSRFLNYIDQNYNVSMLPAWCGVSALVSSAATADTAAPATIAALQRAVVSLAAALVMLALAAAALALWSARRYSSSSSSTITNSGSATGVAAGSELVRRPQLYSRVYSDDRLE